MINTPLYIIDSIETNNFSDPNIIKKIQNIWKKSHHKLSGYSGNIYGIYHKYASDYKGDYTLSIATDMPYLTNAKEPLIAKGTYSIFKVKDNLHENIFAQWQNIWQLEEEKKIHRTYTLDFERYSPNGNIEIFISIL